MTTNTLPIEPSNAATQQTAAIQVVPIVAWLIANWPSILAAIGTVAFVVMKAGELVGGQKSDVYKAMDSTRQQKIDALKQDLDGAIIRENTPGVVKALKSLAVEYDATAKVLNASSNPELGKKAAEMAKGIRELATEAAKGKYKFTAREIGLNDNPNADTLLVDNSLLSSENGVKSLSKVDLNTENIPSAQNLALVSPLLPLPVVVQVMEKALKSLGQAALNDKNATTVAKTVLQTGIFTPDQMKSAFGQYYEHIQGLSPEESGVKAEKIVDEATNALGKKQNEPKNEPENVAQHTL